MKNFLLMIVLVIGKFAMAQNSCTAPVSLSSSGLYTVGVINGTPPSLICAPNGAIPVVNVPGGEWYVYTPTQNYTVTITTDIAANTPRKDTRIHVYTGTCAALTCYANDDDTGSGYSSVCIFNVTAGTPYYINWDNRWLNVSQNTGFTFQLSEAPIVVPPPAPVTFTSQTISTINSAYNICSVDMNGDFRDDIVGVSSANIRVHYQNANGTFTMTDIPTTTADFLPTWSLAAGDYNKDGINDLLYGNGSGVTFMNSNALGTAFTEFSPPQYVFSQRSNFIDINNDGNLDAFVCHDVDPNVYYINDGLGNLTYYQSGTSGAFNLGLSAAGGNYGSIWIDYDNDGDLDLFIAKCGSVPPDELHRNNGNGTYSDISVQMNMYDAGQSWSSAWADFDNDGDMDALVGASSGAHKLKRNDLVATDNDEEPFTDITSGSGWDTNTSTNIEHIAHDFDNDGFVDVMGGGNKIMFNQGNNVFAPVSYSGLSVGAVGDFNNDGFLDVQNGNTLKINSRNSNNWIKLQLQGVQSNRNGIGARVEIYGAFGKQIRDVRSGDGFKFMSSLNVHFGIGQATEITKAVIKWPSGTIDTVYNPAINQPLLVVEGETLSVNLKLFIEGYYAGASTMSSVKLNQDGVSAATDVEDITVELHSTTAPYNVVATATAILKTNGAAVCRFPTVTNGLYYVAIKTQNAVQTWSANPVALGANPANYDFSVSTNKAYGDNMIQLETGVFGLFSGDITNGKLQDDNIDAGDFSVWEADNNEFAFGIYASDLNGDGSVDAGDFSIWEANNNNFIFASYPIAP
jgi:hypothetical protein